MQDRKHTPSGSANIVLLRVPRPRRGRQRQASLNLIRPRGVACLNNVGHFGRFNRDRIIGVQATYFLGMRIEVTRSQLAHSRSFIFCFHGLGVGLRRWGGPVPRRPALVGLGARRRCTVSRPVIRRSVLSLGT